MARKKKPEAGSITWFDLTVKDAKRVRDFYRKVAGWTATGLDMGGYEDFCMNAPKSGKTVAGICHARGPNRGLPPQWLLYINVASLKKSLTQCVKNGGKVLHGPRGAGEGSIAVIRDPAGAVAALYQTG
ncbi:MAG: VOC family protein [Planctomycetes bacterium]|nr:VOC family protein [Planctomycetota bacterium]